MADQGWDRFPKIAGLLLFAGLLVCIFAFTMQWPLIHDASLMQYIASAMLKGQVPYRDIFDYNLPGSYALHIFELSVFGRSDLAWRIFDLLFLVTACGLSILWTRAPWIGLVTGTIFGFYHISWGMASAGQRDFFMAVFLLAGIYYWVRYVERSRWRSIVLGGFLLAFALWIKPTSLLWIIGSSGIITIYEWRNKSLKAALSFLGIAAVSIIGFSLPFIAYLWFSGAFPYLLDIFKGYVAPVHAYDDPWSVQRLLKFVMVTMAFPLLLAVAGMLFNTRKITLRGMLLLSGIIFGVIHFVYQRKGWDYHLYPMALFLFTYIGYLYTREWKTWKQAVYIVLLFAVSVPWILAFQQQLEIDKTSKVGNDWKELQRLEAALKPLVAPGDEVQIFDTVGGGLNLLFRLKAKLPTRFGYDFVFMHTGNAYVDRLKKEFIETLRQHRPRYIVCWNNGWLGPDTLEERMAMIPGFIEFTQSEYTVSAISSQRVIVYQLK